MRKTFCVQPIDYNSDRLPYPYFVDEETGLIGRQDFWKGYPYQLVGFAENPRAGEIDLWWAEAVQDPDQVSGMYPVTIDADGEISTHRLEVASMKPSSEVAS